MPTYNYKCSQCNAEKEHMVLKISDREKDLPECDTCKVPMQPAFTSNTQGGFSLQGPNWFGHSSRGDKKGY